MIKPAENKKGIRLLDVSFYSQYRAEAEPFLDTPDQLNLNMLQSKHWAAVLVPELINKQESYSISEAAKELNCSKAVALTTEPGIKPEIIEVDITPEGLLNFDQNCGLVCYILFPEDKKFVILHEADLYYIIAGPHAFVEKSMGGSIEKARQDFWEYANDSTWPSDTRELLIDLAKKYEPFNG